MSRYHINIVIKIYIAFKLDKFVLFLYKHKRCEDITVKTKLAISLLVCLLALVPYGTLQAIAPTSKKILAALGGKLRVPEYRPELVRRIADITNATPLADEVDELIKVGNLQEIMWRLHDEGLVDKATQLEKIISNRLATDEIVAISELEKKGQQGAQLVDFASGLRGVYKSGGNREVAVYRLDQLLGTHVFPLTTVRTIDGKAGSVQLFIENASSVSDAASLYLTETMNSLRLLANDGDRNINNYLYPYKGRAIAVDGGCAFKCRIEWDKLWRYFNDSRGEKLANLDVDLQKKYSDLIEGHWGYRTDEVFLTRLEKITAQQVEDVLAAFVELEGADAEIKKAFARRTRLANQLDGHIPRYSSDWMELHHFYVDKYTGSEEAYQRIKTIENGDDDALVGLHDRIKQYVAIARGVDNSVAKIPVTPAAIKQALFSTPTDLPVYKHDTQLRALVQTKAWDELQALLTSAAKGQEILRSSKMGSVLDRLSREIPLAQDKMAKPLLWKITAPDGSQHTLWAGNDNISLRVLGEAGIETMTKELDNTEVVLRSGKDINVYSMARWENMLKSAEFAHLFNHVPMRSQLDVWAKTADKKIISAPYKYNYEEDKVFSGVAKFKNKFDLNSAYLDGDLDQLTAMARVYASANTTKRIDALLDKIETHCVQGQNCFVYSDIVDLLADADEGKNFLKILGDKGYMVEKVD